jgi:hypothetical protein
MTFDQWLKLGELAKWPVVALIVIGVIISLYHKQIGVFLAGFSSRKIRIGGAEALPEQLAPETQHAGASLPVTTPLLAGGIAPVTRVGPQLFVVDDSAFFRQRVDNLQQWLASLSFNGPDERERFLIRQGAAVILKVEFEQIYRDVWASQMDLLGDANRSPGGATHATVRAAYDRAAAAAPDVYDTYPFEKWIAFLTHFELLRATETGFITTEKAKTFIQYLVWMGYDLHGRYRHL